MARARWLCRTTESVASLITVPVKRRCFKVRDRSCERVCQFGQRVGLNVFSPNGSHLLGDPMATEATLAITSGDTAEALKLEHKVWATQCITGCCLITSSSPGLALAAMPLLPSVQLRKNARTVFYLFPRARNLRRIDLRHKRIVNLAQIVESTAAKEARQREDI